MHDFLTLTLILLASGVLVVALCRRSNLPPMLGYLIAGIAIGPHALGLIPDAEETRGRVRRSVLMFTIGLEFSLPQLIAMRRIYCSRLGQAQVALTMLVIIGFPDSCRRMQVLCWVA
jgi:CPA2 family monovalent cation:H+ antiporter-2